MTKEEAIRRIKAWNLDPDDMEVLSVVIPELAESDDEKTRNEIIAFIEQAIHGGGDTIIPQEKEDKWIAWFEKQKHSLNFDVISSWLRDHASNYVNGEFNEFHHCVDYDGTIDVERLIADLKVVVDSGAFDVHEQKEQKSAEWSEEYREEDLRTRFAFYTYKDEDGVLYLSNVFIEETSRNKGFGTKILQAAEKVAETIGATTIRLKVKQDSPANAWYRKHGYGYMTFEDGYDWLEKTLEYLKPTKQEWSEEDKK